MLVLYGPYRREGRHTALSNEAFDRQLRASNPGWGVRDLEAVTEAAASHGLALQDATTMPANTLCGVFRPAACAPAYLDAKNIEVKDFFVEEYVSDLTSADDASLEINIFTLPKQ